jgi:hypothetical protein
MEGCRTAAANFWPEHEFRVADDVIVITPRSKA